MRASTGWRGPSCPLFSKLSSVVDIISRLVLAKARARKLPSFAVEQPSQIIIEANRVVACLCVRVVGA